MHRNHSNNDHKETVTDVITPDDLRLFDSHHKFNHTNFNTA